MLPGAVITGARLVTRANLTGFPDSGNEMLGPITQFVFPVAVAVSASGEIYIADAGSGRLFRLDPVMNVMVQVGGARVTQQTRIVVDADGSVLVANGGAVPVARIGRSGQVVQRIDPQLGAAYYDEVCVDRNSGKVYGLDRVQRRIEEIMPHGLGGVVVSERLMPDQPGAMAMDGQTLFIVDQGCGCVIAIDLFGSGQRSLFADGFGRVLALDANEGWVAVVDAGLRKVRIWFQGVFEGEASFEMLNLLDPRGMSIARHTLYIADGAGRRVLTYRLRS